ncbi:hypothetical protein EMIT0P44_330055 [Pseudomonas sp. IT-P44]
MTPVFFLVLGSESTRLRLYSGEVIDDVLTFRERYLSVSPSPHKPPDLGLYGISRRLHRIEILCIPLGKSIDSPLLKLLHMLEFVSPERDILFCGLSVPEENDVDQRHSSDIGVLQHGSGGTELTVVADFIARGIEDTGLVPAQQLLADVRWDGLDAGVDYFSVGLGQPQRQGRCSDLVDTIRHGAKHLSQVWQADAVVQANLFLASWAGAGLGWHFKRQTKNKQRHQARDDGRHCDLQGRKQREQWAITDRQPAKL